MNNLKKISYILSLLVVFTLGTLSAFAAMPTTPNPANVGDTEARFVVRVSEDYFSDLGFLLNTEESQILQSDSCPNLIEHEGEFLVAGNSYNHIIDGLEPGTTYYYQVCYFINNEANYQVNLENDEIRSFTTSDSSVDTVVETQAAENIGDTSARIGLQVFTNLVTSSGFRIAESIDFQTGELLTVDTFGVEGPAQCQYFFNEPHFANGYQWRNLEGLQGDSTYYYQACVLLNGEVEITGETQSFTTGEITDLEAEAQCEVDYIEFLPFNLSRPEAVPDHPRFQNFLNYEGNLVEITVYTKNPSQCAGVDVDFFRVISRGDFDTTNTVLNVGPTSFNANGKLIINTSAGDEACISGDNNDVCHVVGYIKYGQRPDYNVDNSRLFRSDADNTANIEEPDTEEKKLLGQIKYSEQDGDREWDQLTSSQAEVIALQQSADVNSPCFDANAEGGYNPNCYELLAPLPNIEGQDFFQTNSNGRQSIDLTNVDIGDYVNLLFQIALGVIVVIAVIMIIIAGVEYMTVESIYGKSDARKRINSAVTGLLIAFGIFLVLSTINPRLLEVNFVPPAVTIQYADGGGLGISLEGNPVRTGGDPRNISPAWAMENAPVLSFTTEQGTTIQVRACDESQMETYQAFGRNIRTRSELKPIVQEISDEWEEMGDDRYQINDLGGYNCRTISENGDRISTHAYGITVDINHETNPYLSTWDNNDRSSYTNMPESFVQLFTNKGFGWGGNWNTLKDAMHFSKSSNEQGDQRF